MAFFPAKYILRSLGTARTDREGEGERALSRLEAVTQFGADDGKVTTLELGRRSQSVASAAVSHRVCQQLFSFALLPSPLGFYFLPTKELSESRGVSRVLGKVDRIGGGCGDGYKAGPPACGRRAKKAWMGSEQTFNKPINVEHSRLGATAV